MAFQTPELASSSQGSLKKHHDLADWVIRQGGFLHPDIAVAFEPSKGFHALVKTGKTLGKGTRIASCPMEATMSVLNPLDIEPFACHGVQFPRSFLEKFYTSVDILQTFFLMEHYLLGDGSWWAPYLATLPSPLDILTMQFESLEDRVWVRGTNLEGAIDLQLQRWQQNFELGLKHLELENWTNAVNGSLTWELYRWAATMFGTRSFTSQVLSDTRPADLARPLGRDEPNHAMLNQLFSERFAVLLPMLDILNHKPGAQIEWQARYSFVGLEVLETYEQGQELFNNYGPRDNESLLLSYGFVLKNNPFDHVVVSVRSTEGSPLEEVRSWPADSRSNENFNCYIFGPHHPIVKEGSHLERAFFSYDLLDSISVLIANSRELQEMHYYQRTLMSKYLPSSFSDFRNILATISQLMQDCRARVWRLKDTDPSPNDNPQNLTQGYAQLYRASQLEILQNAVAICALVVFHACTDLKIDDILLTMEMKLPAFYSPGANAIFNKLPFLTRQRELLTVDAVLSILPAAFSTDLQNCVTSITKLMDEDELGLSHSDVIKGGFAITLSAMCYEYTQGSHLASDISSRLQAWLNMLTHCYPPGDENWSYVPQPPYSEDDEPPPALQALLQIVQADSGPFQAFKQWLRPDLLCWGWNVMEEEGVRVPVEIERFCNGIVEASVQNDAIGFLMYCRQI